MRYCACSLARLQFTPGAGSEEKVIKYSVPDVSLLGACLLVAQFHEGATAPHECAHALALAHACMRMRTSRATVTSHVLQRPTPPHLPCADTTPPLFFYPGTLYSLLVQEVWVTCVGHGARGRGLRPLPAHLHVCRRCVLFYMSS